MQALNKIFKVLCIAGEKLEKQGIFLGERKCIYTEFLSQISDSVFKNQVIGGFFLFKKIKDVSYAAKKQNDSIVKSKGPISPGGMKIRGRGFPYQYP